MFAEVGIEPAFLDAEGVCEKQYLLFGFGTSCGVILLPGILEYCQF